VKKAQFSLHKKRRKDFKGIPKKPRISYSSSNVKDIESELCGVGTSPVLRIWIFEGERRNVSNRCNVTATI